VAKVQAVVELAASDVIKAEMRELAQGLPISGSLRAINSAVVKARAAGELQGLTVREGDVVKAGQIVARIDSTEYGARVKQAQEQADSAKAQIDIAQRQWDNNKALMDQGFISKTALDTSLNNFNAAQANHKAALAAVEMARKTLDDTVLRAPISGVVAQRLAQPGERVALDGRVIEIVDLSRLELEATLSAADSMNVRVGQEALLQIEGSTPARGRQGRAHHPSAQAGSRGVACISHDRRSRRVCGKACSRKARWHEAHHGAGRAALRHPLPTSLSPMCRSSRNKPGGAQGLWSLGVRGEAGKEVIGRVKRPRRRRDGDQGNTGRCARERAVRFTQPAAIASAQHAPRRLGQDGPTDRHVVHPRQPEEPGPGDHGHARHRGAGPVLPPAPEGRPVSQHRLSRGGGDGGVSRRLP
jgi:biotin carboxyl carrier protein